MVYTYRNMFNKKYGFPPNESHSLEEIAKISGYDLDGLKIIYEKGKGTYARVYSSVMLWLSVNIDDDNSTK
jgi:hypothetical protein